MEAKDTVIKPDELGLAIIKHPELPMGQAISIEQAEITAPIFLKEGMKKIVEWVEDELFKEPSILDYTRWQAKKKKWGLE